MLSKYDNNINNGKIFTKINRKINDSFIKLVMCIILRYNSLESYNQQLAILPDLNKYLHNKYNINFELFASSINCFYGNYCSLFFDLEKYFGSNGNFNLLNIKKGFYVANPPFDEEIIKIIKR
jgi:phosphorylated CTD-interacting factor 1